MTNLESALKSKDTTLLMKVHIVKATVFPVVMWELDHKEDWALKNWCFQTGEDSWESFGHSNEIKPVNPKGKSTPNIH